MPTGTGICTYWASPTPDSRSYLCWWFLAKHLSSFSTDQIIDLCFFRLWFICSNCFLLLCSRIVLPLSVEEVRTFILTYWSVILKFQHVPFIRSMVKHLRLHLCTIMIANPRFYCFLVQRSPLFCHCVTQSRKKVFNWSKNSCWMWTWNNDGEWCKLEVINIFSDA